MTDVKPSTMSEAPFKLPLRPEEDTDAGIVDDNGKYCIALRGHGIYNAKAKRAYIIAAVNQHAEVQRLREELAKALTDLSEARQLASFNNLRGGGE